MTHGTVSESPSREVSRGDSKRGVASILLPVILIILGIAVLVYPVVSTQWNNYRQADVARRYAEIVQEQSPVTLSEQIARARQYNDDHRDGPILDPWLARISEDNLAYKEYLEQLNLQPEMAQVIIPSIDVNLPVYHGTNDRTLEQGVGHLFGSSLPVGGDGNHAVLTGHTGLTNATLFDNLTKLKKGDSFYINSYGEHLKYEVDQIKTVRPEETDDLRAQSGRDLVTLITCTPYGINSHRLLVRGTRVPLVPAEEEKTFQRDSGIVWQWWMVAALTVAALAVAFLIFWLYRVITASSRRSPSGRHSVTTTDGKDW